MRDKVSESISRRSFLFRSSAAALAAGFWPGSVAAENTPGSKGEDFDFVAVNDLHFIDPKLDHPWFATAFEAMRTSAPKAKFVIVSGDLTMHATEAEFSGMRKALDGLKLPVHVVMGNHDLGKDGRRTLFEKYFPNQVNYAFEEQGWQFFGLNSVEQRGADNTNIPAETMQWLDANVQKYDPHKPTVLFSHYPMGYGIVRRPKGTDEVLKRFKQFNLRSIFNGHWHGYTQSSVRDAIVTTNRCCSRIRLNHDTSPLKGWFVCQARGGKIERRFVTVPAELMKDPGKPY